MEISKLQQQRRNRIRRLIRQLNIERKKQRNKIDVLCSDLIVAQKKIVERLQDYNFTLDFSQSIVGVTDLRALMREAESMVHCYFANCGVGVFLLESKGFEFHLAANDEEIDFDLSKIEGCFNEDLINKICHSNAIYSIDDMFAMGFDSDLRLLNKLSVYSIPLSGFGPAVGFMLLWRKAENPISRIELDRLCSITPSFTKAIRSCVEVSSLVDQGKS